MIDLLPIGSIVHIQNLGENMIIGYLPRNASDNTVYDYITCNCKGLKKSKNKLIKDDDYFYTKKENIDNVLYIGFQNAEFKYFTKIFDDIIANIESLDETNMPEKK